MKFSRKSPGAINESEYLFYINIYRNLGISLNDKTPKHGKLPPPDHMVSDVLHFGAKI